MEDQERELQALENMLIDRNAEPIKISYAVLKSITKNFSEDQKIGHGGFGVVYLGLLRNGKVAVKKLTLLNFDDDQFLNEVKCLEMAKHRNIVRYLGYCAETQEKITTVNGKQVLVCLRPERLLCFEYVPNGSLDRHINGDYDAMDWITRYQIIKGICEGLHHLHKLNITHLDLKPENVLLDIHMKPKISDFGLSRWIDDKRSRIVTERRVGTLGYLAPEYIDYGEISFMNDIYSLGVLMNRLLKGCTMNVVEHWNEPLEGEFLQIKKCIDIAQSCEEKDKNKRPCIMEIMANLNEMESQTEILNHGQEQGDLGSSMDKVRSFASRDLLQVHPCEIRCPLTPNKRMSFSLQLTNNSTEDHVAFIFQDLGKAEVCSTTSCKSGIIRPHSTWAIFVHLELKAGEKAVTRKQYKDIVLVRSTIVSQGFNADDISIGLFNRQTCVHDIELDFHFIEPSLNPGAHIEETENEITLASPGSINTEMLDIYPLELRFPFPPTKSLRCPISLTNMTDHEITFWIRSSIPVLFLDVYPHSSCFKRSLLPHSTCGISLVANEVNCKLAKAVFEIIMVTKSSLDHRHVKSTAIDVAEQVFMAIGEKGGKAHQVSLFATYHDHDKLRRTSEQRTTIDMFGKMASIDVHPTEKLILTGHHKYVCIWSVAQVNSQPEKFIKGFDDARDFVVKFIARRQWIIAGDSTGKMRVYTAMLELLHTFTAHGGSVRSFAVHSRQPYVLSSSDDCLIKLWNWDHSWTCTKEFSGHMSPVTQVAFNPNDDDTFISVSRRSSDDPGNVKIWSISSADCKADLYGKYETVDWSSAVNDRQYMVTYVGDGIIEIWDRQTNMCVHRLINSMNKDSTKVLACHPTLPLLITGTKHGTLRIWNLATNRMEYSDHHDGAITGFGFIDLPNYKRLVLGYERSVILLKINLGI